MTKIRLDESFDNLPTVSLKEGMALEHDDRVDGEHIIGMIEGQFFKPDGMSRNKRWYPKSLWVNVLNRVDTKTRLADSTMFGEIGHSDGPIEDQTLRTGCASHILAKLWIDEAGHGMGRAYILNTPTGRLLRTYLGAGCKLKVSTRGEGSFKEGEFHDGCPVVNDEDYEFQTIDFVLNPGFLETSATLKEAYQEVLKEPKQEVLTEQKININEMVTNTTKEGEQNMTIDADAYISELKAEKAALAAKVDALNEELKAKDKELLQKKFSENAEYQKLKEAYEPFKKMKVSSKTLKETFARSQKLISSTQKEKEKLSEELKKYKEKCGSLEQIDEATRLSSKALMQIREYQKLGTVAEIKKLTESAEKALVSLKEYKYQAKIARRVKAIAETYRKQNAELKETARLAEKALVSLKEYKELKPLTERALDSLTKYKKLVGSLSEATKLSESLKPKTEAKVQKIANKKLAIRESVSIAREFGCTVESAAKLVKKYGAEKAKTLLESKIKERKDAIKPIRTRSLQEGKKLIESATKLDEVTTIPAEKTAEDYLATGMITNYFNKAALGKKIGPLDINKIGATEETPTMKLLNSYIDKCNAAKKDIGVEVEAPVDIETTVKKLLK